jgi:hypothetical protein
MNHLLRLLVIGGLAAGAIVVIALGLARNDAGLMAPVDLTLFLVAVVAYLLPAGLAVYRDCKATVWIVAVDVLLGWTVFGWVIALGWAASGKAREARPTIVAPPTHPLPGH